MIAEYALYKGEDILAIGTLDEISEKMNVKRDTITFYMSPTYRKRGTGKNRRVLIKLEDEDIY